MPRPLPGSADCGEERNLWRRAAGSGCSPGDPCACPSGLGCGFHHQLLLIDPDASRPGWVRAAVFEAARAPCSMQNGFPVCLVAHHVRECPNACQLWTQQDEISVRGGARG